MVFVVCGSNRFYGEFWSAFHAPKDHAVTDCISRAMSEVYRLSSALADIGSNAATTKGEIIPHLVHCSRLLRPMVVWEISGILLTLTMAVFIYWFFPIWKLRTQRLQPMNPSDPPGLPQEFQRLCVEAALPAVPILVWNPLAVDSPLAFGRNGQYYVALSGAFIARYFYADKGAFRAIVRHELAHIRNGDIDNTYLTIAAWIAFLLTNLAPAIAIYLLTNLGWPEAADLLLNGILWTGVITLSGLAVLRAREYYADVQACVWDRTYSNMDRALAELRAATGAGWRRHFRFHPEPIERRQVLADTSRLFRLSVGDAIGIGVAAWVAVDAISGVAAAFFPPEPRKFFLFFWSIKVAVPAIAMVFAVGAIGIGVWRGAFASLLRGEEPSKGTGRLGVALVIGYLLEQAVYLVLGYLDSAKEGSIPFRLEFRVLETNLLIGIILMASCFLIFRWISDAASAWLEVVLESGSPRAILILTVAMALILVVGTFASATFVTYFLSLTSVRESPDWIYSYGLVIGPPLLFASVVVWAFPLAAWFWRKGTGPPAFSSWVFLEGPAAEFPHQQPLRPGGALMTGLVIGLAFWLLWEMVYFRGYFRADIANQIRSAYSWFSTLMVRSFANPDYAIVMSAVTFQACAAAVAAVRARRFSALCGLFAASVAASIVVVGDFLFFGIGTDHLMLAPLVLISIGAVVALPTAIVAAWVRTLACRSLSVIRRGKKYHGPDTTLSNSSITISIQGVDWRLSAVPFGERKAQKDRKYQGWSLFSRGCVACLGIVVGIGWVSRIRQAVLAEREVNFYRASAERGDSNAQNKFGTMYFNGQSVTRDDGQAVFWWRKAAEQGHAAAQNNLGMMYAFGRGTPRDDAVAVKWFRKAADQGVADAQNNLGMMYFEGRTLPKDDAVALQWFRKAAEQGHAAAQNNLGMMYAVGRGTPRDDAVALKWVRKAAEQGHPGAQDYLGQIYEQGRSVNRDDQQALVWFRKAAEQGYLDAREHLQSMCARGIHAACSR
jgi:TPR repeat protein/Zn-dependent protease with chaperone function